jgi:hypothetical protein
MVAWFNNLRSRSIAFQVASLGAIVLAMLGMVGPVAFQLGGFPGILAAALAATLCFLGAAVSLMTSHLLRGPQQAIAALLVGMALRMGIPLLLGLAVHLHGGPLAQVGLLYYVLVFYPVTLAIETLLSLPEIRRPTNPDSTTPNAMS